GASYQWVDLDGEGLPGVLCQHAGALSYKRNLGGGRLAAAEGLTTKAPMGRLGASGQQIADIDGDGEKELVFFETLGPGGPGAAGYHDRTADGTRGPLQALPLPPM